MIPSTASFLLLLWMTTVWVMPSSASESLRLRLQTSEGREFEEFLATDGRIKIRDEDNWVALNPRNSTWHLDGSLHDKKELLFPAPPHSLRTAYVRSTGAAKVRLYISITDKVFESRWPSFRERTDAILVGVWIVDGAPVLADAASRPRRWVSMMLPEDQLVGFPALLLWADGHFLAPEKTFEEEAANRYLSEALFRSTETTEAVLEELRALDNGGREGQSLLHLVSSCGPSWSVKQLIDRGARVDARSSDRSTALMSAVLGRRPENVKELINAGADVDARDRQGHTTLSQAIVNDSRASFQLLIEFGANWRIPRSKPESLSAALLQPEAWFLRQLIQHGARDDLMKGFPEALSDAAHVAKVDIVRALLEVGFDPAGARTSYSPIHEVVRKNPFGELSSGSAIEILKMLLESGADPNTIDRQGRPPLYAAIDKGDLVQVQMLLDAGADLELRDAAGDTALNLALENEDSEITRTLASAGARFDTADAQFEDSIVKALRWDIEDLIARTIDDGWNPSTVIFGIWSPSHLADWYGASRSAALLETFGDVEESEVLEGNERPEVPPRPVKISKPHDPRPHDDHDLPEERLDVNFVIDQSGQVRFPRIDGEVDDRLARAVFQSLSAWRFSPAQKSGVPVNLRVLMPLTFPAIEATYDITQVDMLPKVLIAARFSPPSSTMTFKTSPGTAAAHVKFVVERDGSVSAIHAVAPGGPVFEKEIVRTLEAYKFAPGEINGEAVRVEMSMLMHIGRENQPSI